MKTEDHEIDQLLASSYIAEPRLDRIRDHLRQLIIEVIEIIEFPVKATLLILSKTLRDLEDFQSPPQPEGQFILGCGRTEIAAGQTVNIAIQCLVPFRPSVLIIPRDIAPVVTILDVRIGKNSQLLSVLGLPAKSFALEDGTPIAFKMDVLNPGQHATLTVRNDSNANLTFSATLVGQQVDWY
jgi:hypothetical protein